MNEFWDVLHDDFITEGNEFVLKRAKGRGDWNNTNYGKLSVPSKGDCVYEWHIKINKITSGFAFIGIADAGESHKFIKQSPGLVSTTLSYLYYGYSGKMFHNAITVGNRGITYKSGNIVIIELNTTKPILDNDSENK